ncbi:MAG: KilA-N domain-containing protein [Lewinellaceae bacterium]|nr:KilA-N domain-containing protein [Lewinellaceae bacterium]
MAKKKDILVQGKKISLISSEGDYLSLTDIDSAFEGGGSHIENWMRNRNTVEFLGVWEIVHNPDFNSVGFDGIFAQTGLNRFKLSVKKWTRETNAIGIKARTGRYGGTYAHPDIAFNFALWLSPTFQVYIAKEFQRLKQAEAREKHAAFDWSLKRLLTKINYSVHTDAIKETLIPPRLAQDKTSGLIYADEADILNLALFGMTAKEWRVQNSDEKGNIRDQATTEQLLVLANLEAINAELIRQGLSQDERVIRLNEAAITQMRSILSSPSTSKIYPPDK